MPSSSSHEGMYRSPFCCCGKNTTAKATSRRKGLLAYGFRGMRVHCGGKIWQPNRYGDRSGKLSDPVFNKKQRAEQVDSGRREKLILSALPQCCTSSSKA